MTTRITILGSTGSIGESTLRVMRSLGEGYAVYGLACRGNLALLEKQIREFRPAVVAVESPAALAAESWQSLRRVFSGTEFLEGPQGIEELAGRETDILVQAIVGGAGLRPTLAAIGKAKRIALANKETLVMAGDIVMERIRAAGTELIPVDSEHSAVFALLEKMGAHDLERIILTASGGSLRDMPLQELDGVTPGRALAHPTWSMGSKITIDSATLMNKGLEVIEAHHLFGTPFERISVIIHPESVVHSMVETRDGTIFAHMGVADMAHPILYAITYPMKGPNPFGRLSLEDVGALRFARPDHDRFPGLDLCYEAGRRGGTVPAVLNAANEVAVEAFLAEKILFTEIVKTVEKTMQRLHPVDHPGLEDIFRADREARELARDLINGDA